MKRIPDVEIKIGTGSEDKKHLKKYHAYYLFPNTIVILGGFKGKYLIKEFNHEIRETSDIEDLTINTINHEYLHHIIEWLEGEEATIKFENLWMYMNFEVID